MANKNINLSAIGDNIQSIAKLYLDTLSSTVEMATENLGGANSIMSKVGLPTLNLGAQKGSHNCCPPVDECPPHCLLTINRHAYPGERIVVPFMVKNNCSSRKQYRLGVRELKDINGTIAPSQPVLSKPLLNLENGESQMVLMVIDLQNFQTGTYNSEIVIREKDINQNICFSLVVDNYNNLPVANPIDEKKYNLHWQSWQRHFYCETPKQGSTQQTTHQ